MPNNFADSDENTVSDGATVSPNPSTGSLPDLPNLPDYPSLAALPGATQRPLYPGKPIASQSASSSPQDLQESIDVFQKVRIGQLALTVDNPEFAHAMPCGIEYAREDLQPPPTTTQGLLDYFIHSLECECNRDGQIESYASFFGSLFGEICYLVNHTKRLDFRLDLQP